MNMQRLVVTDISDKGDWVEVVAIRYDITQGTDSFSIPTIVGINTVPLQSLPSLSNKLVALPLNFSIVNGEVKQDCGVFTRLKGNYIILDEICSKSGRTLGYTVLDAGKKVINTIRIEELIELQKRIGDKMPVCQNGIIRTDSKQIACYPNKPFNRFIVEGGNKSRGKKSRRIAGENGVPSKLRENKPKKYKKLSEVEPLFADKRVSPEQQEILDKAKENGALTEYFNHPDMPKEVMQFYGERIVDKKLAEDCKPIFDNPNLEIGQVEELYDCVVCGIDCEDLCDGKHSPMDIRNYKQTEYMDLWGDIDNTTPRDEYVIMRCMETATKLKQGV